MRLMRTALLNQPEASDIVFTTSIMSIPFLKHVTFYRNVLPPQMENYC